MAAADRHNVEELSGQDLLAGEILPALSCV